MPKLAHLAKKHARKEWLEKLLVPDLRAAGYTWPAEWEAHKGTWLGWPEDPVNWRDNAKHVQAAFVEVVTAISQFEPVTVCTNAAQYEHARAMLPSIVRVLELSHRDSWFRDQAPLFVKKKEGTSETLSPSGVIGVDFAFNAWGGIYEVHLDRFIRRKILSIAQEPRADLQGFVLEGGSVISDGEGTLITTEQCLLSPNRNCGLEKSDIEAVLCASLGLSKVIWLPMGFPEDNDTDGHVDNLCVFARPGEVLLSWGEEDTDKALHDVCSRALAVLEKERDAQGRQLVVHKLPAPPPMYYSQADIDGLEKEDGEYVRSAGDRLVASYANLYLATGAVIAPTFGSAVHDEAAHEVLRKVFPTRQVVPIRRAIEIIKGGGGIHCITMQQPQGNDESSSNPSSSSYPEHAEIPSHYYKSLGQLVAAAASSA